jgi:DNA-directed RNA polymerase subunit E'/Rpb7
MSSRIASSSQSRRNAVTGKMSLYIKNIISKKLSVPIKFVGTNISEILEQILNNNFEGKCCIEGYVKRGSVKIITFSSGTITGNCVIFTVVFEYLVCNPPQGMRISCAVKNITNAGILAHIDDGEYSPLNIFIARDHHYNIPYFSELKESDIIMIRVIGQRFELNDPFISVIGELELKHERESQPSIMRKIENSQKKGSPLSLILEENSDMLGEFQISNMVADAAAASAAAAAADKEPESSEESEEPEEQLKESSDDEGGEVENKGTGASTGTGAGAGADIVKESVADEE